MAGCGDCALMTKKYVFRSLGHLGQMYDEAGEEVNMNDAEFVRWEDFQKVQHAYEVEAMRADRLARPGDRVSVEPRDALAKLAGLNPKTMAPDGSLQVATAEDRRLCADERCLLDAAQGSKYCERPSCPRTSENRKAKHGP